MPRLVQRHAPRVRGVQQAAQRVGDQGLEPAKVRDLQGRKQMKQALFIIMSTTFIRLVCAKKRRKTIVFGNTNDRRKKKPHLIGHDEEAPREERVEDVRDVKGARLALGDEEGDESRDQRRLRLGPHVREGLVL
jgi:hypothetical protein